eukprot:30920-Pelagococcus_subviridis.AAC.14
MEWPSGRGLDAPRVAARAPRRVGRRDRGRQRRGSRPAGHGGGGGRLWRAGAGARRVVADDDDDARRRRPRAQRRERDAVRGPSVHRVV